MGRQVSAIVDEAIAGAGLSGILAARRTGSLSDADAAALRGVDLLALGALADRIRAEEVGPDVRIYTGEAAEDGGPVVLLPRPGRELTGLELLREVAIARVSGRPGARVRVDWTACGLELAQVALGFGASELYGRIANKRGLPFAEGELAGVGKKSRLEPALAVKEREIAGFVRRAGRTPVFVHRESAPSTASAQDRSEEAT
jgi:hypothetical protein